MDLLVYLASRPGEVVSKEELGRDVWKGAFVGDDALVSAVAALRRALGDNARRPQLLQTIPKRGYRLIASVAPAQVAVAVLPLENLSGDPAEEFLADGMTDALISALGRHPRDLQVTSRTSSMRYKQSDASLPEIAESLGVDVVVEGGVLRLGELIRISVQLIDAQTDHHLMSRVYERGLGDVLALQGELAYDVDRAVREVLGARETSEEGGSAVHVTGVVPHRKVDPRSFLEYLRGRHRFHRFTQDLLGRSLEHFEAARDLDPGSPYPYLGIADVWGWRAQWGLTSARAARSAFEEAIGKLTELGEGLAETHVMQGKFAMYYLWDWDEAEAAFKRALALNSSDATALWSYALLAIGQRRFDEAISLARRATALDPLNPAGLVVHSLALTLTGHLHEGLDRSRRAAQRGPLPPAALGLWISLAQLERWDEALASAARYFSILGQAAVAALLAPLGDGDTYAAAMTRAAELLVEQGRRDYVQPTQVARLFLYGNEHDRALEWLETAFRERDPSLIYLNWPEWEPLRSRSEFRDLMSRVGLPA